MAVGLLDEMLESCILPFEQALTVCQANVVTSEQAAELISAAGVVMDVLEVLHGKLTSAIAAGIEGRTLACRLHEHAEHIQKCSELQAKARDLLANSTIPADVREARLQVLDDLRVRTSNMRDQVDKLRRWLASPRPKLDLAKLPGSEKSAAAERFENLDHLIDALKRN